MVVTQEMYLRVHELSWQINGLREHKGEGMPTVMVRTYGNIGMLEVEVFPNGWTMDYEGTYSSVKVYRIYSKDFDKCYECIKYLENVLEEKRICLGI